MLALLLPLLGPILDRVVGMIPDPQAAAKAKADALAQLMDAATKADAAQLEVNKAEAASGSVFVAGWRPFIGWTCGAACAWNWVGLPLGMFVMAAAGQALEIRPLDLSEMLPLLLGMLGMGGLRTFEKVQGVARQTIAKPGPVAPMAQAGGQG
jgi:hypothetical protein